MNTPNNVPLLRITASEKRVDRTSRKRLTKILGFAGVSLLVSASLALSEDLLSLDFATENNLSISDLQSKYALTVDNYQGDTEAATSRKFLRLGGNLDTTTLLRFPLGNRNTKGSVKIVLGTSASYANAEIRLMSGVDELFKCTVNPKSLTVSAGTEAQYPGDFVTADRETKENCVAMTFSWDVSPKGGRGTISYALTQPDKSGEAALKVNVGKQTLKADGIPDTLIIEPTQHDHTSRIIDLYEIKATRE